MTPYGVSRSSWILPPPPLPTKVYTMLVTKFEKHPLFADFERINHPFWTEIADFEANKTPIF